MSIEDEHRMDDGDSAEPGYSADEAVVEHSGVDAASEIADSAVDEPAANEHALRGQVAESQRALDELESELRAIDGELDSLAERSHEFELLDQVCRSLEELDGLGARELFWGDGADFAAARVESARHRIEDYGAAILDVESRREALVGRIGDQNLALDFLHYDLTEAIEREESRQNEWVVERDADDVSGRVQIMPWSRGYEEDKRFRKSLGSSILATVALALLVSSIALPIVDRKKVIELPERVAKLVRQELPAPPPPEPEPVIEEDIPEPEPELADETPPPQELPESVEKPAVAAADPDPRQEIRSKGILAFRDSIASTAMLRPNAQLGSQARIRTAGEDTVGRPERSMVTTLVPGSSGGINLADISRDVGGGGGQGLQGVEVSRVASSIGGGGTADRPMSGGASAGRTDEEIQIVFDRYKAALYRLYNRELRRDPTLRGQIILRLTIEPDGSVSFCALQSSDMNAPTLAEQVVDRVATFDFGAKDGIIAMTIIYPIDFLPAA